MVSSPYTVFRWATVNDFQGFWGYEMFQSDRDFDTIDEISAEAELELDKVVDRVKASETKYPSPPEVDPDDLEHISLYPCKYPDLVRDHLDSGILVKWIDKRRGSSVAHQRGKLVWPYKVVSVFVWLPTALWS